MVGLVLDIAGVLIILNPLLEYFNSRIEGFGKTIASVLSEIGKSFEGKKSEEEILKKWQESIEYKISDIKSEIKEIHSKDIKNKKRVIIGTFILILGFFLQIIGNWKFMS